MKIAKIIVALLLCGILAVTGYFGYEHYKKYIDKPTTNDSEEPGTEEPTDPEGPGTEEPTDPEEPGTEEPTDPEEPDTEEPEVSTSPATVFNSADFIANEFFTITEENGVKSVTASTNSYCQTTSHDEGLKISNDLTDFKSISFDIYMTEIGTAEHYFPEIAFNDRENTTFFSIQLCAWRNSFTVKLVSSGGVNKAIHNLNVPAGGTFNGSFKIDYENSVLNIYLNDDLIVENYDIKTNVPELTFETISDISVGLRVDNIEKAIPDWNFSNIVLESYADTHELEVTEYNEDGSISFNTYGYNFFKIQSASNDGESGIVKFFTEDYISVYGDTITGLGYSQLSGVDDYDDPIHLSEHSSAFTLDKTTGILTIDTTTLPFYYFNGVRNLSVKIILSK